MSDDFEGVFISPGGDIRGTYIDNDAKVIYVGPSGVLRGPLKLSAGYEVRASDVDRKPPSDSFGQVEP